MIIPQGMDSPKKFKLWSSFSLGFQSEAYKSNSGEGFRDVFTCCINDSLLCNKSPQIQCFKQQSFILMHQ